MHQICFRFLNEDGLLLVQGSIDEHHYTIGSASLPVLDIKEVAQSSKNVIGLQLWSRLTAYILFVFLVLLTRS